MSDYSESGALPVDDAVVPDPPTEDEVRRAQDERYPTQAATRQEGGPPTPEQLGEGPDHPGEGDETRLGTDREA